MSDPHARFRAARLVLALRQAGVVDGRVLEAIERTPREVFVPASSADAAWDDVELPIACGQNLARPVTVGVLLQALESRPGMTVLEVGCGTGYLAAALSRLVRRVYTTDRYRTLAQAAEVNFDTLGLGRIEARHCDGLAGWPQAAPFDRIVLSGSVAEPPPALLDQLAGEGALLAPIGTTDGACDILRVSRDGDGWRSERVGRDRFTPLERGAAREL